jgi:hypothetical protein
MAGKSGKFGEDIKTITFGAEKELRILKGQRNDPLPERLSMTPLDLSSDEDISERRNLWSWVPDAKERKIYCG